MRKKKLPNIDTQMYTQFTLRLNDASDSDIIARINSMQNKQGYLKRLVREDIQRTNGNGIDFLRKMIDEVNEND